MCEDRCGNRMTMLPLCFWCSISWDSFGACQLCRPLFDDDGQGNLINLDNLNNRPTVRAMRQLLNISDRNAGSYGRPDQLLVESGAYAGYSFLRMDDQ